jgi:hypothetical protein
MTYAKPFAPNKPFGTVMGDPRFGYEQDGQLYDGGRRPVDGSGQAMELEPQSKTEIVTAEEPVEKMPEIDLRAWADGRITAPWVAVTSLIQKKFDVTVANKKEALDVVNENLPSLL